MANLVKPAVLAVNYYSAFGSLPTGTATVSERLFDGQTNGLRNDLSGAILPDNRSGDITAMFFRNRQLAGSTAGAARTNYEDHYKLMDANLSLSVNAVEIVRGPIWAFPHPPSWVQGSSTDVTFNVQNGGYMLMAISHTVGPRQRIGCQVFGTLLAGFGSALPYSVTLQVADKKPVV